jgi:nucleoid DNA-binding protein
MKADQILENIKAQSPALFAKIDDKVAARLVKATLAEIAKQLTATDTGAVAVPGLGRFKVKPFEKEKDGEKKTGKRISFKAAKPNDEAKKAKRKAKKSAKSAAGAAGA